MIDDAGSGYFTFGLGEGGNYGGGGGAGGSRGLNGYGIAGGTGADGAVRIIWPGTSRQFPITDVNTP
jgi:hypothetical protein